ncbi:MAG TPA: MBL fold metallo-hydrolase [Actinomycetota bacterium]|nr:MBL fold metallo-hydrolase [Actinomycetota bacterium]
MEHRRREPAPGIFRLVLPLPFPGLDAVNAFLLSGDRGATLVDCGIRNPAPEGEHGWDDLVAAFAAAGAEVSSVERLVVTHTHIDHYGMAARIVEETGCELWMHRCAHEDLELYRDPGTATVNLRELLADHGASPDELDELTQFEDWRPFVSGVVDATHPVTGGESFDAGGRAWTVIATPGHARSHICLWTDDDGLLVSGDHLLPTITPHIDFERGGEEDPLGEFLESLEKIEDLDPKMVLPGHGRPFLEGADRARVIARHHDRRLGNILQVIRHEPRSASDIVDEVFGSTLLHFERRLALGEALAHLAYLRKRGEVERIESGDGTFLYKKVSRRRQPIEVDE